MVVLVVTAHSNDNTILSRSPSILRSNSARIDATFDFTMEQTNHTQYDNIEIVGDIRGDSKIVC